VSELNATNVLLILNAAIELYISAASDPTSIPAVPNPRNIGAIDITSIVAPPLINAF